MKVIVNLLSHLAQLLLAMKVGQRKTIYTAMLKVRRDNANSGATLYSENYLSNMSFHLSQVSLQFI